MTYTLEQYKKDRKRVEETWMKLITPKSNPMKGRKKTPYSNEDVLVVDKYGVVYED